MDEPGARERGALSRLLCQSEGAVCAQLLKAVAPPAPVIQPDWAPDGTRIAFISDAGGFNDVWVMNADGSHAANLTNDDAFDERPDWQPLIRRR